MEITGIKVVATDEEIVARFRSAGFKVYKKTFNYCEKGYHNRDIPVTETKWVVEHPVSQETLLMRDTFNAIINKYLGNQLIGSVTKQFMVMNFN